jgi:hypothetical protein
VGSGVTDALRRGLQAARLSLKINRFEVVGAVVVALGYALWAVWLKLRIDATGFDEACYRDALANPEASNPCFTAFQAWSDIASGEAGRAMGGSLILPFLIGLALGVPLVGREIEQRTAATAWGLAGSRRRWLLGRMWPALALVLVLGIAIAGTSEVLSVTRSMGESAYDDAIFIGLPVLGHMVLALGIGVVVGAVVGRTLPAFLVAMAIALLAVSAAFGLQGASRPYMNSDYGDGGPAQLVDLLDPRWDWDFITADGRILTRDQALATVPPGTQNVSAWLADAYQLNSRGVAGWLTADLQFRETVASLGIGGFLLIAAFPIVDRRRPG